MWLSRGGFSSDVHGDFGSRPPWTRVSDKGDRCALCTTEARHRRRSRLGRKHSDRRVAVHIVGRRQGGGPEVEATKLWPRVCGGGGGGGLFNKVAVTQALELSTPWRPSPIRRTRPGC